MLMKKTIIVIVVLAVVGVVIALCCGRNGGKLENVSDLQGVYEGEAVVHLDDKLKEMVDKMAADQDVALPEGPIHCKVGLNVDENGGVTMELVDFIMPVKEMSIEPSVCTATKVEDGFSVTGEGKVKYGMFGIKYSHEGKIVGKKLTAELKMAVPLSGELKVNFEGERNN